jgi:hypothetical protein
MSVTPEKTLQTDGSGSNPLRSRPLRVVVADANFLPHRDLLEANLPAGTIVSWHKGFDEAAVAADLPGADVFVGPRFTAAMGAASDALRLVHVGGAGYDGIDADALPRGVVCANTFCHETSIAEYVAVTTVVVRRQLLLQDRALRAGHWASSVYESQRSQVSHRRHHRLWTYRFADMAPHARVRRIRCCRHPPARGRRAGGVDVDRRP